ncbi:SDR family NAD(P)-dependent oxidoreductase [Phytohabitans kaempferiae]|uniref:SDR family NAD(P)-dependent oxidoreductase n=1 Tax=Phytohabitans kaempferiae TaxID=1620943 RepID=A0ABV6MHK9_9ACTN
MSVFNGHVIAITGAGQGLGRAMAQRFAAEGAVVALADLNPESVARVGDDLRRRGTTCRADQLDVASPTDVNRWIRDLCQEYGRIDVMVNNAGVIRDNRVENITDDDWRRVLDVNLTGAFHCVRAVLPVMRSRQYGRILFFSSMSWRGNFGQANYVAAKAGIVGLTRAVALEGARDGITSNAIAPGLIETPMLASMNDRARDKLVGKVPMGRTGQPGDIAEAATFLCSPAAGYITGVVLDVDGGVSIGSSLR